nr:family 43 glycosylhydrolase [uncultured Pedobacter sp.]
MNKTLITLLFLSTASFAKLKSYSSKTDTLKKLKPMVADVGMADPHIHIFNNKAYLYATRDGDKTAKTFVMPDWKIWTSTDLVNWKLETTIDPATTYMGKSNDCWAPDMAYKNGKYYFYFSNGNVNTGVLVGNTPIGPFKDVLGKPLLPENLTPGKEYDPTVIIEKDKAKTAYIAFGHYRAVDPTLNYMIAKLNSDMISLDEKPRKLVIKGSAEGLLACDKPNLHQRNGIYYLSAGTSYATSRNIYGPYTRRGYSANIDLYGLNTAAHGNFFEWNNQWFHTWCHFYLGKDVARYRQSYVNYLHYKDNGDMVDDINYLDKHGNIGIGQYDANWDKIEAEWYMASAKTDKRENTKGGFSVNSNQTGGYLYFPNFKNVEAKTKVTFNIASEKGGTIEIRANAVDGELLASCVIKSTGGKNIYKNISTKIVHKIKPTGVYIVFKVANGNLVKLDSFKFD